MHLAGGLDHRIRRQSLRNLGRERLTAQPLKRPAQTLRRRTSSGTAVETTACLGVHRTLQLMAGRSGLLRPLGWHIVRVVDVRLQVERGDHRLGLANVALGSINRLGHF
jgi:hypothetical protein